MLRKEIIAGFLRHINILRGQKVQLLHFKGGGG